MGFGILLSARRFKQLKYHGKTSKSRKFFGTIDCANNNSSKVRSGEIHRAYKRYIFGRSNPKKTKFSTL